MEKNSDPGWKKSDLGSEKTSRLRNTACYTVISMNKRKGKVVIQPVLAGRQGGGGGFERIPKTAQSLVFISIFVPFLVRVHSTNNKLTTRKFYRQDKRKNALLFFFLCTYFMKDFQAKEKPSVLQREYPAVQNIEYLHFFVGHFCLT
jgi:hypothetical protein